MQLHMWNGKTILEVVYKLFLATTGIVLFGCLPRPLEPELWPRIRVVRFIAALYLGEQKVADWEMNNYVKYRPGEID